MRIWSWVLSSVVLLTWGCVSQRPILERGWIGASFEDFSVDRCRYLAHGAKDTGKQDLELPDGRDELVVVSHVFQGTPSASGGLEPGDAILALDGFPLERACDLRRAIDDAPPGTELSLKVYRFGATLDKSLTVGRERFQKAGSLSLGLALSPDIDVIPNPDFNLLGLVQFHRSNHRIELHAPTALLARHLHAEPAGSDDMRVQSREGFHFWFLLFGINRRIEVLSQESAS